MQRCRRTLWWPYTATLQDLRDCTHSKAHEFKEEWEGTIGGGGGTPTHGGAIQQCVICQGCVGLGGRFCILGFVGENWTGTPGFVQGGSCSHSSSGGWDLRWPCPGPHMQSANGCPCTGHVWHSGAVGHFADAVGRGAGGGGDHLIGLVGSVVVVRVTVATIRAAVVWRWSAVGALGCVPESRNAGGDRQPFRPGRLLHEQAIAEERGGSVEANRHARHFNRKVGLLTAGCTREFVRRGCAQVPGGTDRTGGECTDQTRGRCAQFPAPE